MLIIEKEEEGPTQRRKGEETAGRRKSLLAKILPYKGSEIAKQEKKKW